MLKYSELRKNIEIQPLKDENNEQAYVTHYLHNLGNGITNYFKEPAIEYLTKFKYSRQEKFNFRWDIPFPTPKNPKFKFIDLFAGIGGIRLAYQKVGGKCVFSSEYNKFAKVTYEANFGEVPFGDITKIDAKYTLSNKLWNYLQNYAAKQKAKKNGFGVTTRVGLSVIALILLHNDCGVPVASFGRLLTTHIPNVTKQRLPLQSLTQLAA